MPVIGGLNLRLGADTIPDGPYNLLITDVSEEMYKDNDKKNAPYVRVEATVQDGDYAGYKMSDIMSFSPAAARRLTSFLKAIDEYDPEASEVDTDQWLGKTFIGDCAAKTYNERESMGITGFHAVA